MKILSDRSAYSSVAYQGFGRELGYEKIYQLNDIAVGGLSDGVSPGQAYEIACEQINQLQDLMASPLKPVKSLKWNKNANRSLDMTYKTSKTDFENSVKSAKEFIKKGDVFQLVISQKLESTVIQKHK